jgi:hypothetical protein
MNGALATLFVGRKSWFIRPPCAAGAIVLGVISLIIALAALAVALLRDPFKPGFGVSNPLDDGLGKYDLKTAAGAYKAQMEIDLNGDLRAVLAIAHRMKNQELKEQIETLKIAKELDYTKKAKEKSTDYRILFTTYKENGEEQKRLVTMKKDPESGFWRRSFLGSYDVEKDNKELAQQMRDWEEKPRAALPPIPPPMP